MADPLSTDHLGLPYLAPAQAQKHVTHNEALQRLDTVVQLAVEDASLAAPPGSPDEGVRYLVAASATGAWTGKEHQVAAFLDGAWEFIVPEPGWLAFDRTAGAMLVSGSGGWSALGGHLGAIDKLGVNATADDTNRLAVRSDAVLFSNIEAADGGTGDVRFVVNKEASGDTASLLFQSGWSGRAEIGLAGDDDLVLKVSGDGSAWNEAIRVDKDSGLPTIRYDNSGSGLAATSVQQAIDEVAAEVAGKQASDSDLTALAGNTSNGLWARTGAGSGAARTLAGPAAGVSVSNGDGVSGNPTLALANDLAGLEGLSSTGIAVRSAADTWVQRAIAGTTNEVAVTNGDGVSGNPAVGLAATLDLSGKTVGVTDANFSIKDDATPTKVAKFEASGISAATTRTFAFPDTSGTLALAGDLSSYQPLDSDLTALAGNSADGFWAHIGAGTGAARTFSAPAAGLTIANPAGIAGNPTFALANDLSALEGLSGTGLAYRTGTDAWSQLAHPTSTTDNGLPRFDGTGGNVQTSGITIDDANAVAGVTGLNGGQLAGFRNLLINPNGRINQRAPSSSANNTLGHDRWVALTQTSTIAVSTVSDAENGTPRMWRLTQSQATAQRMGYAQWIEGANCKHLRGKQVTLSGRIAFSLNAAVRYAICEWTGTEDTLSTARDPVNDWTSGTYTGGNFFKSTTFNVLAVGSMTPAAATLTDLAALTATVGSSANNLVVFIWTEGTAAQNATLDGAIQLEVGAVASAREHRSIGLELALCQRYFQMSFPLGTAPAQNTGSNVGAYQALVMIAGVNTQRGPRFPLPVWMRAAGSATTYNPNAANANGRNAQSGVDCTFSSTNASDHNLGFNFVGDAGGTVGQIIVVHYTLDAEL